MRYDIQAYDPVQGVVALSLEATGLDEARALVAERSLNVLSIRRRFAMPSLPQRGSHFDLPLFSQELRSLLDAGLSLLEALGTLSRKETHAVKRRLIDTLLDRLREGKSFSTALRNFPEYFPPLYIALAAASEQTGDLASALGRYIAYRGQMDGVKKRMVSAAIYPALLIGVGGLVILFLMSYVVPRFAHIYEDVGRDLPLASRLLIQWGSLVREHGGSMLAVSLCLGVGGALLLRRTFGWHALLQKVLAIGKLSERVKAYTLSRFYRTLGMLQQGGIPIISALTLARELLDAHDQTALDRVQIDLRSGIALSSALEGNGLAPPVASDLLKVGEKTGNIGDKMVRIADFFDEDLSRWIEWFSRLFEPLLMLVIGLFIALVVVLMYLPIFELAGSVQ